MDMLDERQTYKGLTLEIIITTTERITHTNECGEQILWHEATCDDAEGPSMDGMKRMVDHWEYEGELNNLPNAGSDASASSPIASTGLVGFGDYVRIEQKRYGGGENEMYLHKVIGVLRSNSWVDVPVQSPATETIHDHSEDVLACVCCGVCERDILRYRFNDCKPNGKDETHDD